MGTFYKTTCTLVAFVLCLAMTASARLVADGGSIIQGEHISIEDAPWQVALTNADGIHFCAGAIINTRFIVTSGYCLTTDETIKVRSGSKMRDQGGVLTDVKRIIRHDRFQERLHRRFQILRHSYDIGLIELKNALTFGPATKDISLAKQWEPLPVEGLVQLTGWGYTSEPGNISPILLEAIVPILDMDKCLDVYADDKIFCVGNRDQHMASCPNESGGPAVLNGKLVGIVSGIQGAPCREPEFTGTFTLVREFREWIDEHAVSN